MISLKYPIIYTHGLWFLKMSFSQNEKKKQIHILETVIGKKNIQIEV
jgi:hypothetical protein